MARADPAEQAMIRMELRRFTARCDMQAGQIRRADSLREVARLTSIVVPYKLSNEMDAREYQRRVTLTAEERARELIAEQVAEFNRAEGDFKEKLRAKMRDDWANLTGQLAHLRSWANNRLLAAEQNA
jgi:thioesterase domain-containing protein